MINSVSTLNCKPIRTPHSTNSTSFVGRRAEGRDDSLILKEEREELLKEFDEKEEFLNDSTDGIKKLHKSKFGKILTPALKAGEIGVYAGVGALIGKAKFLRSIVDVVANSLFKAAETLTEKKGLRDTTINFIMDKTHALLNKKVLVSLSEKITSARAKATAEKTAKAALAEGEKLAEGVKLTKKEAILNIIGKITNPLAKKFKLTPEKEQELIAKYKPNSAKELDLLLKRNAVGQGVNATMKFAAGTIGAGYGAYKGVTTPLDEFPDKVKKEFSDAIKVITLNGNG